MRIYLILVVLALCAPQANAQAIVNFEDLSTGARYYVGQEFLSNGVAVSVSALSSTYTGGNCSISNRGYAAGVGNEAWTGNVLLHFNFGSVSKLSLLFGNYGGYNIIEVNGESRQVGNLLQLDGIMIGGVNASVTQNAPSGNVHGSLTLTGPINSFGIGGQEFAFDNVTAAVPEPPSVLSLLIGCCSMVSMCKLRRRYM